MKWSDEMLLFEILLFEIIEFATEYFKNIQDYMCAYIYINLNLYNIKYL